MGDGGTQGAGPMQVEIKKEGRRGGRSNLLRPAKGTDARCRDICSFPAGKVGKKRRKRKGIGQLTGSCERSLVSKTVALVQHQSYR